MRRKRKQRLPTSTLGIEGEDSQVWLDNSLPIVGIWMELFAGEVVKS